MEKVNEILREYVIRYGFPPKIITVEYEDDIYINLMKKALERYSPITREEIEQVMSKIDFDLVTEDEELSASAYADKYSKED